MTVVNRAGFLYQVLRRWPKRRYRLGNTVEYETGWMLPKDLAIEHAVLHSNGLLVIYRGFKWDGMSGPVVDLERNMRAGLVHDALYRIIRVHLASQPDVRRHYRQRADRAMWFVALEDGVPHWVADLWYRGVRVFGRWSV